MNKHKRYLMQEQLKYDKQQMIFTDSHVWNEKSFIKENDSPLAIKQLDLRNRLVFCPFCLSKGMLHKFVIGTKKGFSKRYAICPECLQGMFLETLLNMLKWTPKEYAEFVFNYHAKFWNKCNFKIWKKRLYDLDLSLEFWERYKALKGEYNEE